MEQVYRLVLHLLQHLGVSLNRYSYYKQVLRNFNAFI